jgi:hypothetical protein
MRNDISEFTQICIQQIHVTVFYSMQMHRFQEVTFFITIFKSFKCVILIIMNT